MSREILFRGKELDSGKWEYGHLYNGFIGTMIITPDGIEPYGCEYKYGLSECFLVDPATVGEYTGLVDKNDVKIFEGDVVFVVFVGYGEYGEYYEGTQEHSTTMTIDMSDYEELNALCNANEVEVIGNVHDNPKLAKEKSE